METQPPTLGSPGRHRPIAAALCVLIAAVIAAGLSIDIVHRLRLFWFSYSSRPGMNHVADDHFFYVYAASAAAILTAVAATLLFRSRPWRAMAGGLGALNAALCAAFFIMHRTAVLVTYHEYAAIHGP